MRSRKLPIADVEVGHRTTSLCQIANIALFAAPPGEKGRKLRWDPRAERFLDAPEADRLLGRENRPPYLPRAGA